MTTSRFAWCAVLSASMVAFAGRAQAAGNEADEASASEPASASAKLPGVNLLARDSLAGWTYGPEEPEGWKVEDGTLVATDPAAPLVSGYTVGDFELHVAWTADAGSALRLGLIKVPSGKDDDDRGIELRLAEQPGVTIRMPEGARNMKTAPQRHAQSHATKIVRSGRQFTLVVDGKKSRELPVDDDARFSLALALEGTGARVEQLRLVEPAGRSIFNGVDLAGWNAPSGDPTWKVDDGLICAVLNSEPRQRTNYLATQRSYENFTLRLEYKICEGGNSGVGIRTPTGGWPSSNGIELQILDRPTGDKRSMMAIYKHVKPLRVLGKRNQWNELVVKADGPIVSAWLNGELAQHANTARVKTFKKRPRAGWIGLQNHRDFCQYRNLTLLAAPAGDGLPIWTAAQ